MVEKLWFLIPEMCLFAGAVVVSVMGLSRRRALRDSLPLVTCVFLLAAFVITPLLYGADRVYDEQGISRAGLLMPMLGKSRDPNIGR